MPRMARVVAVGYPHHITQRGNNRQAVFYDAADYLHYLKWLKEFADKYRLAILAYCLMPNHIHLIAIPYLQNSLSKIFNACHMLYSQYLNRKKQSIGHIWQARFHSCVLDEKHLYAAVRYVENNPVRAGLVERAEDWKWSSARSHLYNEKGIISLTDIGDFLDVANWKDYLSSVENDVIENIRANTMTGRPLGSEEFVTKLEKDFGRPLRPMKRGRKKGTTVAVPELR